MNEYSYITALSVTEYSYITTSSVNEYSYITASSVTEYSYITALSVTEFVLRHLSTEYSYSSASQPVSIRYTKFSLSLCKEIISFYFL